MTSEMEQSSTRTDENFPSNVTFKYPTDRNISLMDRSTSGNTKATMYIIYGVVSVIVVTAIISVTIFIVTKSRARNANNSIASGRHLLGIPDSSLMSNEPSRSTELDIGSMTTRQSQSNELSRISPNTSDFTEVTMLSNLSSFKPIANSTLMHDALPPHDVPDYVPNSHQSSSFETPV